MDTKLTLKLSEDVIERAKKYAKMHKVSVSKLIESYLDSVTKQENKRIDITPLVEDLSGVMEVPDVEYKKSYGDYLEEKYK